MVDPRCINFRGAQFQGYSWFCTKNFDLEVLSLLNTSIMNYKYFKSIESKLHCKLSRFKNTCSIDSDLPIWGE